MENHFSFLLWSKEGNYILGISDLLRSCGKLLSIFFVSLYH